MGDIKWLDISIDFNKLALTPHQLPLDYLCDHESIILNAIKQNRSKKTPRRS